MIYPALEALALVEPRTGATDPRQNPFERLAATAPGFHIIITSQPRGSIPTHLWGTSYLVFVESL